MISWRRSTYSDARGECVELSENTTDRKVRDSKNPEGGALSFSPTQLRGLVSAVKAGTYDL